MKFNQSSWEDGLDSWREQFDLSGNWNLVSLPLDLVFRSIGILITTLFLPLTWLGCWEFEI